VQGTSVWSFTWVWGLLLTPNSVFFYSLKKGKLFNVHKEVNNSKLRRYHKTTFELYLSLWLIFKETENTKRNTHREENQLDATECCIALIICSTCFGHLHAHHQKLETILVLLPPHMVCNALVAGGRNNTSIVSSSWWWECKCPKHVEQIISAIKHLVASSWFFSVRLHYDARTNIHQIHEKKDVSKIFNSYILLIVLYDFILNIGFGLVPGLLMCSQQIVQLHCLWSWSYYPCVVQNIRSVEKCFS